MVNMRTAARAFEEIKKKDPETAISERQIRAIMRSGVIPVLRQGNKTMVNMDVLMDYFAHPAKYLSDIAK